VPRARCFSASYGSNAEGLLAESRVLRIERACLLRIAVLQHDVARGHQLGIHQISQTIFLSVNIVHLKLISCLPYPIISPTNFFFVGSSGGKLLSSVNSLPFVAASGFSSALLYTSMRNMHRSAPLPPCPALRRSWAPPKSTSIAAS